MTVIPRCLLWKAVVKARMGRLPGVPAASLFSLSTRTACKNSPNMEITFFVACALLLVGFVLRATIRPLQMLHIPAAVAGGIVGLVIAQGSLYWLDTLRPAQSEILAEETAGESHATASPEDSNQALIQGLAWIQSDLVTNLRSWPGWLIAVLFAGLLLEKKESSLGTGMNRAAREGIVVWIIALGQAAVGLVVTWLILQPFYDLPNSFGMLIETGFAGGHGTAGAMGVILEDGDPVILKNGRDFGMFMATMGLAFSVVSGIIYVNLAVRLKWTRAGDVEIPQLSGLEARHHPEPIAYARIRGEVLDPLVFQALILATAVAIGYALQYVTMLGIEWVEYGLSDWVTSRSDTTTTKDMTISRFAGNIPLFIFTLLGGLILRKIMSTLRISDLIDTDSLKRLTAATMEFLVISAITSLNLLAIKDAVIPLGIMLVAAFGWTAFCLLYVARKLLPSEYWFELGILNYGMSTGTTATGFVLLRIVDKELESGAAEDFALAAPLSAPFVGGGVVTLGLPLLLLESQHIGLVAITASLIVTALFFLGRRLAKAETPVDKE